MITFTSTCPNRLPTVLFASALFAVTPAMADDTTRFQTADADSSGTLTLAEFRTLLPARPPQKVALKKFHRADANHDDAVTLEEWLAYRADVEEEIAERAKFTATFESADADDNGFLTYDEFIPAIPGKKPLIQVRKQFLRADTDGDLQISLEEWLAMKTDDMDKPIQHTKFDLADRDGDGQLTLDEFSTTFPRKTPAKVVSKKFNREDENDDGFLTRDEWNPGGKKTVDPT